MKNVLLLIATSTLASVAQAQTICPNPIYGAPLVPQRLLGTGSELVAAGFTGAAQEYRVGTYDGANWALMPGVFNGSILALAETSKGLVAAGTFTEIDGVPIARVARFESGSWVRFGAGIDSIGEVLAVQEFGGDLYCGGTFTSAGGVPVSNISKWNGTSWEALGSGIDGPVRALASHAGLLVAGGSFGLVGGSPLANVAAWDGASFFAPGLGALPPVFDFDQSGGSLFAAATGIYELSVGAWTEVGDLDLATSIHAEAIAIVNGVPVALGEWITFCQTFGGEPCIAAARYVGGTWITFLTDDINPNGFNLSLASFNSALYLNGATPGSAPTQLIEYSTKAALGSMQPKVATWYQPTQLTLNVGCLDPASPATVSIGGSAPILATVTSPTTLTATLPPGVTPGNGVQDVIFEQNGKQSLLPNGFEILPSLSLVHLQVFASKIELTVNSASPTGTAWLYAGVTSPPQPFQVPGIQGLVEIPLAQLIFLGAGALGVTPTLSIPYNLAMVPTGIQIKFQGAVAEVVGPSTLWAVTNSRSVTFFGFP